MSYLALLTNLTVISLLLGSCSLKNTASPTVTIEGKIFYVELADTPQERAQGLSGRPTLLSKHGMLFIYPEEDFHSIWTRQMRFPIDIIWINNNQIIDFQSQAPAPSLTTKESDLPIYKPSQKARYVLELPADTVNTNHLKVGSPVTIQLNQ